MQIEIALRLGTQTFRPTANDNGGGEIEGFAAILLSDDGETRLMDDAEEFYLARAVVAFTDDEGTTLLLDDDETDLLIDGETLGA